MLTGRNYFLGALYQMQGGFSHLPGFITPFKRSLNTIPFSRQCVLETVEALRQKYAQVDGPVNQDSALHLLLAEELERVEDVLQDDDFAKEMEGYKESRFFERLHQCKKRAVDHLQSMEI